MSMVALALLLGVALPARIHSAASGHAAVPVIRRQVVQQNTVNTGLQTASSPFSTEPQTSPEMPSEPDARVVPDALGGLQPAVTHRRSTT